MRLLQGVKLREPQDRMAWMLEKSGRYTTKSMCRFLLHRGLVNTRMRRLWKNRMPMKVKVFMWLVSQNRIQSGEVLGGRKWKGDKNCKICKVLETSDHIFFNCPLAKFLWVGLMSEALGWDRPPGGLRYCLGIWLPIGCSNYSLKLFALAITLWTLWNVRNKMAIEGVF
jgi:hypothetical protein